VQCLIKAINPDPIHQLDPQAELTRLEVGARLVVDVEEAYRETQPRKIFDNRDQEGKVAAYLRGKGRICPMCGLRVCTCKNKYVMDRD
jgi:hypothetical protein